MAFSSYRTRFKGTLDGIEVNELNVLDLEKDNVKERMAFVEQKHEKIVPFYNNYLDNYYKVNVNTDDELSSQINIFKALERDGSYILNSRDIPRDRQQEYKFYNQEEFDKLINNENKMDLYSEGVMEILERPSQNHYKNMDLIIKKQDIEDQGEMGYILRQYEGARIHLRNEMANLKNGQPSYLSLYKIKNLLGGFMADMLDTKKHYKRVTRPSTKQGDESGAFDTSAIDYTNPEHIKVLLKMTPLDELQPDNELSHLGYDMKVAITALVDKGKLDLIDLNIIEGINAGVTIQQLGAEVGMSHQAVSKRVDSISKKIAKHYADK